MKKYLRSGTTVLIMALQVSYPLIFLFIVSMYGPLNCDAVTCTIFFLNTVSGKCEVSINTSHANFRGYIYSCHLLSFSIPLDIPNLDHSVLHFSCYFVSHVRVL